MTRFKNIMIICGLQMPSAASSGFIYALRNCVEIEQQILKDFYPNNLFIYP